MSSLNRAFAQWPMAKVGIHKHFYKNSLEKPQVTHQNPSCVCAELEDYPLTTLKSVLLTGDAAAPPTPASLSHLLEQGRTAKLGSPGAAN